MSRRVRELPRSGVRETMELALKTEGAVRLDIACSPEQVVVTVGGAGAVFVTLLALLEPGDEVLVPDPGWTFSKTYAMTGWRIGYAVAPRQVTPVIALAQEAVVSCPSTVAQKGAEAALLGPREPIEAMRTAYRSRRDLALARLDARGIGYGRPRGAFYVMVDLTGSEEPSRDFARRLLLEERVALVPGSAFGPGGESMVRISLAASEESIATGIDRLADALERPFPASPRMVRKAASRKASNHFRPEGTEVE